MQLRWMFNADEFDTKQDITVPAHERGRNQAECYLKESGNAESGNERLAAAKLPRNCQV